MKHKLFRSMPVLSLLALLVVPAQTMAQQEKERRERPPRYVVTDLGPLDTPFSEAIAVTDNGLVTGAETLPDGTSHAAIWYNGRLVNIGQTGLGGPNSAGEGVNEKGQVSGLAELSTPDPNGEDFCGFGTHLICLPFLWWKGVMTSFPTLGGVNGEAGQINSRGEVAGNVENAVLDPTCVGLGTPQKFEEKPVIWKNGEIYELPTYLGDPDGWTFGVNDKGQVVGASGGCSTLNSQTGVYVLSRHALLWDRGEVTDLGNLGGSGAVGPGNVALGLNNRGQVIGVSDLQGDTTYHGFVWTKDGGIKGLGTLSGDVTSVALGINDEGAIVGASFDVGGNPRAFLRQDGVMTDLNKLISADAPLYLLFAHGINSQGVIVGFGVDTGTGNVHAYLATPCDNSRADIGWCGADINDAGTEVGKSIERPNAIFLKGARDLLQQRLGRRYHL